MELPPGAGSWGGGARQIARRRSFDVPARQQRVRCGAVVLFSLARRRRIIGERFSVCLRKRTPGGAARRGESARLARLTRLAIACWRVWLSGSGSFAARARAAFDWSSLSESAAAVAARTDEYTCLLTLRCGCGRISIARQTHSKCGGGSAAAQLRGRSHSHSIQPHVLAAAAALAVAAIRTIHTDRTNGGRARSGAAERWHARPRRSRCCDQPSTQIHYI